MPKHRVRIDAVDGGFGDIVRVDVADKGVGRIVRERVQEFAVILFADGVVAALARERQIFVHQRVRVARVVRALVRAEDLVGVVIGVKRAAPADETRHLAAPVHLRGDVHRAVDADLTELLRRGLRDVDAVLLAGHDADDEANLLAVSLVVAAIAHRAADGFKNFFRFCGIVVVVVHGLVVVDIALERAVRRHALPEQHRVDDGLTVDGVADGGDDVAVFRPVGVVEVEEDAAVVRGGHVVAGVAVLAREVLRVFRVEQRKVDLAGLELHRLRIVVGYDLEDDALDVRRAQEVVLVAHEHDGLPGVPAFELVGPCADGGAEKGGFLHVLALEQMLRQDRHRHVLQKCGVRLSEAERDGVVVEHGDLLHVLVIRRVFRAVVGVHDGFDREFDVLRRERLAVVPLHPLAQVESIGAIRLVIVPALGEGGNDLVIAVVRGQSVEEQQVDLAVLVHRGIDARVVGRAVDERGRRVVGRVAAAPAAGGKGEEHREGQQKSQRFFHGKTPFREKIGKRRIAGRSEKYDSL